MRRAWVASVGVLLVVLTTARAEDWPGWRGPTGQGQSAEKDLPLTWGKADNLLWKVRLPGTGGKARPDHNQSSPVVCRGHVFLTSSVWPQGTDQKEFPEHHVLCYRLADGMLLWDATVPPGPWKLSDLRGGYTAPTPAADGERVYVVFGSAVIAALTFDGKPVWRKEIVPFTFDVAMASSPVLYGDTVLLQCDGVRNSSRLMAYDRKTGDVRWEKKRPDADFSHSTPVVALVQGKPQLLVAASNALQGLDPASGDVLWRCDGKGDTASPVLAGGVVYCDSGRGGLGVAVDPTGSGDVTKTLRKWSDTKVPEGFSSPVAAGDLLYRLHQPGMLRCWKASTGAVLFDERLDGVSTTSSPFVTADGRLYLATAGRSYVLRVGPKLDVLGQSDLGDDGPASPAVADGRILLRGREFLYCVGKKEG